MICAYDKDKICDNNCCTYSVIIEKRGAYNYWACLKTYFLIEVIKCSRGKFVIEENNKGQIS